MMLVFFTICQIIVLYMSVYILMFAEN
jgi:hypothetical protein